MVVVELVIVDVAVLVMVCSTVEVMEKVAVELAGFGRMLVVLVRVDVVRLVTVLRAMVEVFVM